MGRQDVPGRLSAAYRVDVDEATKDRHIADVEAAIRVAPPAAIRTGFALRRRAVATAAAVAVFAAPVGMAVAAENAVPGEILYPLKQVTERVRALVDDDIAATHRVEEAERLVVRGAPIAEITGAIERAEAATARLAEGDTLESRLESVRERLRQQNEREPTTADRQESPSTQTDGTDSGSDKAEPNSDEDGSGGGSATTSVPQSEGQGSGGGERSDEDGSTSDGAPPPQGDAETGTSQGHSGTHERDGFGAGSDTPVPTTDRQGSSGGRG